MPIRTSLKDAKRQVVISAARKLNYTVVIAGDRYEFRYKQQQRATVIVGLKAAEDFLNGIKIHEENLRNDTSILVKRPANDAVHRDSRYGGSRYDDENEEDPQDNRDARY